MSAPADRPDSAAPPPSAGSWAGASSVRRAVVWTLATAVGATSFVLLGLGGPSSPAPYFGTRLGMSEPAVRARFEGAAYGKWIGSGPAGPPAVRWTRTAARPGLPLAVTFEFNEGKLVAIRADLESTERLAVGPAVETSFAAVVGRELESNGAVRLTVLSRTCSKHIAEAARLIASASQNATFARIANRP